MPYIKPEDRTLFESYFGDDYQDLAYAPQSAGELNYLITRFLNRYINCGYHGLNYQKINDCIGVLECAKLELYRRVAAPYEDVKIDENGDIDYPSVF